MGIVKCLIGLFYFGCFYSIRFFLNICLKITGFFYSDCLGLVFLMRHGEAQTNDLPNNKLLRLFFLFSTSVKF